MAVKILHQKVGDLSSTQIDLFVSLNKALWNGKETPPPPRVFFSTDSVESEVAGPPVPEGQSWVWGVLLSLIQAAGRSGWILSGCWYWYSTCLSVPAVTPCTTRPQFPCPAAVKLTSLPAPPSSPG